MADLSSRSSIDVPPLNELAAPSVYESLTLLHLRAIMRYAYETAKSRDGLTLDTIGSRMGITAANRRHRVRELMTKNDNPGIFVLDRFACAVGFRSLSAMLQLDAVVNAQSNNKGEQNDGGHG